MNVVKSEQGNYAPGTSTVILREQMAVYKAAMYKIDGVTYVTMSPFAYCTYADYLSVHSPFPFAN
jgi:hypothetical protein